MSQQDFILPLSPYDTITPSKSVITKPKKEEKKKKAVDTVHFYDAEGKMYDLSIEEGVAKGLFASVTTVLSQFIPKNVPPWMVKQAVQFQQRTTLDILRSPDWRNYLQTTYEGRTDPQWVMAMTLNAVENVINEQSILAVDFRNKEGSDFGSVCHALCANYVGNAPLPEGMEVGPEHIKAVEPVFRWIDKHVAEQIYTEKAIVHKTLGYAGTMDCFAKLKDGTYCLYDFKFKKDSYKFPMHPDWTYALQLSAYARWIADERKIPIKDIRRCNILAASQTPGDKYYRGPRAVAFWYDHFYSEKNKCDVYWNAFDAAMKLFKLSVKGVRTTEEEVK